MAVPVDGVRVIFEAVLNTFAGIEYDSVKYNFQPLIQETQRELYNLENPEAGYLLEKEAEYSIA
jgi:DNA (cytosine-5)-methyltransferase 1